MISDRKVLSFNTVLTPPRDSQPCNVDFAESFTAANVSLEHQSVLLYVNTSSIFKWYVFILYKQVATTIHVKEVHIVEKSVYLFMQSQSVYNVMDLGMDKKCGSGL